ncbi:hypothetical protein P171DRAFT_487288 [Karstenula rhodostoma CBS 690.94]|uniref:Uncharacterized protein n=1 Tax=Karstenula rhodostoma CBS 690.94 TaxID=1392251 RepID=A0A9P4U9I4_9PLEO|nr:hypothetical protein P171DRAFT_487288 [Karstenula rhodostoma CBS 690.94]
MAPYNLRPRPKKTRAHGGIVTIQERLNKNRVAVLANGFLSLEVTPIRLIELARINAQSPLLRLPPEIRAKIYGFVLISEADPRRQRPRSQGNWSLSYAPSRISEVTSLVRFSESLLKGHRDAVENIHLVTPQYRFSDLHVHIGRWKLIIAGLEPPTG